MWFDAYIMMEGANGVFVFKYEEGGGRRE